MNRIVVDDMFYRMMGSSEFRDVMNTRFETTLEGDGMLMLKNLAFRAGDAVEVTIRPKVDAAKPEGRLGLRGIPVSYAAPFEPVAADDWESAR